MSDVPAAAGFDAWRAAYEAADLRDVDFETMSGVPLEPVYGPEGEPAADVGWPGQFPYTRGPYASMYRSKLWTMRMFAGFGTAEDTNLRFRDLLAAGGVLERQRDVGAQGSVGPRDDGAVALSRVGRGGGSGRSGRAVVAAAAPAPFSSSPARGAEPVDQERPRVFL